MYEEIEKIYFFAGAGWFDRAAVQAGEAGGVAQTAAGDDAAALQQEEDKAWQYYADGRYKEAEPLYKHVLAIEEKTHQSLKGKTAEQK